MQYAMLVYHEPDLFEKLPADEVERASGEYYALRDDPACIGGGHLQPITTATTLRERDGRALVTDGPFADTKEVLGGYYVVEADDLDAATAFAERIPMIRQGGAIEIRPLVAESPAS
jgi:hypothetical protein